MAQEVSQQAVIRKLAQKLNDANLQIIMLEAHLEEMNTAKSAEAEEVPLDPPVAAED